ncbi:MAG: heme-copper oxidase subunit III [candidate division NC10 bacterium]|nr:heme-copper oxidase subunit III [candidate division NC10 bacterium]
MQGIVTAPALEEVALQVPEMPPILPPGSDNGDPPGWQPPRREPVVSNAVLGMLMFLAFETMFFAGLLGAFLVFRLSSTSWPPPGEPYLPIGVTWFNTGILVASAYSMRRAHRAIRDGSQAGLVHGLGLTALLGTTFLAVQGSEWIRLAHHGLTLQSGTYGATFYTLIGCHGVHVLAAVLWLATVWVLAARGWFSREWHGGIQLCKMYWMFVVGLWLVLFPSVYLM